MFRKIAIGLVAASVLTAPVLAQTAPSGDKGSQTTSAPTTEAVKTKKAVTKHHVVIRHHRHGKAAKYAKYTRHMIHGKSPSKQESGARASAKPSKPTSKSND